MQDLLNFLNSNTNLVVAFATVAYSVLTYFVLRETTLLRKVETDPLLAVYLQANQQSHQSADLVIENIGRGPAYDLRWKFYKEDPLVQFLIAKKIDLQNVGFFKGWRFMAPGQKFVTLLESFPSLLSIEGPAHMRVSVSYANIKGEAIRQEFLLDPNDFRGTMYLNIKSFTKLVDATEEIGKKLRDIDNKLSKFNQSRPS